MSLALQGVLCLSAASFAQQGHITHEQAVARARQLVSRMTLEEKLSQLHGTHDDNNYRVILGVPRLGIPDLHMTNGPAGPARGGAGPQKPATAMPSPLSLAATWDPKLAYTYGKIEGSESRALGSELFEAPDVNIARVPQGGRTFESYGEDPYLASRIVVGTINGIQSEKAMASVKHFVANNQEHDRNTINEVISERALREIYLPAFEAAVKESKSATLMCAYPSINGKFSCENKPLLNDILKKEWGFDGFVISDWGATHTAVPSVLAGLDVEMSTGYRFAQLKDAIAKGELPESAIDAMLVRRFAKMYEFNLFGPQPKFGPIPVLEHGQVSRRIASQGIVLLKNEGNLLPLPLPRPGGKELKDLVAIGPYAVRANICGDGSAQVIPFYSINPHDAINATIDNERTSFDAVDGSDIDEAVSYAKRREVAIVMVGDLNGEGSDHPIELSKHQNELIEAVAAVNKNTIVVLKTGSAVLMPWIDKVPVVLEAWYPGEEDGHAVADVLFGKVNPSGKLPLSFPKSVDQTLAANPMQYPGNGKEVHYSEGLEVGYRGYAAKKKQPLFPFGFGLSYTTFSIGGLTVSKTPNRPEAKVSFRVTNTGQREGAEVAQLYLTFPPIAEGNEPPIQLKGFQKVFLKPGESKTVTLSLNQRAFSYWSDKSNGWQVASGAFQVLVGNSSANTPLKATVTLP